MSSIFSRRLEARTWMAEDMSEYLALLLVAGALALLLTLFWE